MRRREVLMWGRRPEWLGKAAQEWREEEEGRKVSGGWVKSLSMVWGLQWKCGQGPKGQRRRRQRSWRGVRGMLRGHGGT